MSHFLKKSLLTLLLLLFVLIPLQGYAQEVDSLHDLLSLFGDLIWGFGGIVSVIFLLATVFFLWGAALFILNAGNDEKRKEGKQKFFWGIITLTVMFGIWGIIRILQIFIGDLPPIP